MTLNSNVDVATTTTTVASSFSSSSSTFYSSSSSSPSSTSPCPSSPHPSIVPGSTASRVEVTLDLTMSCKSHSQLQLESLDSYGSGSGHSPRRIYSSDISPYPSYCNKGNTSYSVPSNITSSSSSKTCKMISCKNSLDVLDEEEPSSYLLFTGGDLSSFALNRPVFHERHLPYSAVLNSSYNKLSPMSTPSASNHIQTFIHRPMSPCYLSSNSLSSSLSAISSSSVSSSSSSDNDSLDELEHLASKFNLNIASIWSNSDSESNSNHNCDHSHEDKSSITPSTSTASCDFSDKQQRHNESQWLKSKQQLPLPLQSQSSQSQSHSQATYDAFNSSLFPSISKDTLGNLDTSISLPPPPPCCASPSSSFAHTSATAAIAPRDANYVTQHEESKIASDISPSAVTGLVSIWSFDSADQVNDHRPSKLKSQSIRRNVRSLIESNPKDNVEPSPSDSDIFSSHSRQNASKKEKSIPCSSAKAKVEKVAKIELIDLTLDECAPIPRKGKSVDLVDQGVIIDANESITGLEDGRLHPSSCCNLTREPVERSIEQKLSHSKANTVTECPSDDDAPRVENGAPFPRHHHSNNHCSTSSPAANEGEHSPQSPMRVTNNIHTGDDSSDLPTEERSIRGRKLSDSRKKRTIEMACRSPLIASEFDDDAVGEVSLANHTASSLFKPGNRKSSHSHEELGTHFHSGCNLTMDENSHSLSLQEKTLNCDSQVPPWYLHYLANVMSGSESTSALAASLSMALTYDEVQRLKSLYMEKGEDLYNSPRTHFQPIRQDYYERPCNTVTDSSIVGMVPCSRNCPNHAARAAKSRALGSNEKMVPTVERTKICSNVKSEATDFSLSLTVTSAVTSPVATKGPNCQSPPALTALATARPMSESREELASFIGPFSPVDGSSLSESQEYQDEHFAQPLSRGVIVTSGDSTTPTPSTATSVAPCNESLPCHGNAWSSVSFGNQGEISNHQLTTLSVIAPGAAAAAGAHASMTDGNGDIEVPSKCSSSINGENALTTEGSITFQLVTPGESGTNSKDNRLLSDKIVPTPPSSSNCESNEMIVDAHTLNKDQDTISIPPTNRLCHLNQATVANNKPHFTRKMDHSTGKSSKVVIEELESDDEITSSGSEFAMVTTTTLDSASKVTIEDTMVNRPDSPIDDYATICSIVNDVLKSNQIVIEEGNYEDELKLLPSDLRQRHRQLFTSGHLFSGEGEGRNTADAGCVSSSSLIPVTGSQTNLDWSLDSPNSWSLFSSSRFSSSATSSPSFNESPIRSSNGVSSTTAFHQEATSTSNSSNFDSFEYTGNPSEKHSNHHHARLSSLNNVDIAIFTDGSSNSSNSSSSYSSLNQKQQQYCQVSSTVTPSDSVVSSSNHELLYGTSTKSTCSSSTNIYYDSKLDLAYNSSAFGHLNDPFVQNEYPAIHNLTSTSQQQFSPSSRVSLQSSTRAASMGKSSSGPGHAAPNTSRVSGKQPFSSCQGKGEYLSHPSRDKSSSPTVYQIEPRLEKVTAFSGKPCTFFLEGNCRKSDCKYSHDLSTITCKFWKEGFCFKGDLCPFAHDDLNCNSQPDGSLLSVNEINEEEKNVFTIDSEADFPSLANEKNSKHSSRNLHSSQISPNDANSKELASKRGNSNKISSTNVFTAVASVLNPTSNSFLFSTQTSSSNSTSNVLFKSQSNVKGKKKKRTTLKAI